MMAAERTGGTGLRERVAELVRFFAVGGVNMVFGFVLYAVLVLSGLTPGFALLLATIGGVFFNFFSFGSYTFRKLEVRRLPRFLVAYGGIYVLNLVLLEGLRWYTGWGPIVSQAACLVVVAPTVYVVLKAKVFQELPHD